MSKIIVYLHHHGKSIAKQSLSTLSAVNEIKSKFGASEIVAVLIGADSKDACADLAGYGISKAYYSETEPLHQFRAAAYAKACLAVIAQEGGEYFVAPSSSSGKDIAPVIAQELGSGQASDIIAVNDDRTFKRPIFAGNLFADVEITTAKKTVTVRTSAFAPAAKNGSGQPQAVEIAAASYDDPLKVTGFEISKNERPELGDAEVVVSGGRALQSAENFEKIIFPLADSLNAAVGASRAAVDSGYAPNDWQVGQTGKVVAPKLYIAVGISGAIQHLAGMKDSKTVVAINKDAEAPIFEVADYGLVGDLFDVAPKLTEAIKKAKQ